ncbi:MAG TPA: beta-eliminating lyase-related protein, partial [Solirubrobacteraceae bacterium]|nr:beta-eliminating lyase-related protein [Solirubrobacteraceae bacterium]
HGPRVPRDELAALAARAGDIEVDRYGGGELVDGFERRLAALLGTEAAAFMPSGTMAQQAALRVWCDRTGRDQVAMHPTAHPHLHEEMAYAELHHLHAVLVGDPERAVARADLDTIDVPIAALLLELPQREVGGELPTWDDLTAMAAWARERGVRLHLDGARLWECLPAYGCEPADICAFFDSVYVSFYKGLGGIAGAALAGPQDVVDEARLWRKRHGGTLFSMYPYVLAAERGLDEFLPMMATFRDAAIALAARIRDVPGLSLRPDPPHVSMFHLTIAAPKEAVAAAGVEVMRATGVWLFDPRYLNSRDDTATTFEVTAGLATLDLGTGAAAEVLADLAERSLQRA